MKDDVREYMSVELKRVHCEADKFLDGHSLQSLTIEKIESVVINGLVYKLKTEILAEEEPKELYVAVFKMCPTWWQQFKEEKFPKWLKQKFPVRWIFAKKYLTIHREAWYPQLPVVFPKCGKVILKDFIEEKEIRNY